MSQENKNAPDKGASLSNSGAAVTVGNHTTNNPPLSKASLSKIYDISTELVDYYLDQACDLADSSDGRFSKPFAALIVSLVIRDNLLRLLMGASDV